MAKITVFLGIPDAVAQTGQPRVHPFPGWHPSVIAGYAYQEKMT